MGIHQNHNIQNLEEIIPTLKEIKDLENKFKQKSELYKEIKNKINIWKNKIITKAEQLIKNLEKEIIILEKIIFNFNNKFMNYTYYNNFHYIKDFIDKIYNEYLIKFNDSPNFKEQSLNLINLFTFFNIEKPKTKFLKTNIKEYHFSDYEFPELINNKYFFFKINNSFANYDKNENIFKLYWKSNGFKEAIYNLSLSLDKKIIYACLNNKKIVKFFYLNEKEFSIKKQEIFFSEYLNSHFNKCIQLIDKYLATADDSYIIIWKDTNKELLEIERQITIATKTSDLILVNNEYIISSQHDNKTIIIININTFKISKIISNIDCIDSQNSLFNFQDYVIINCVKDIQILFKETKEITQNIQNFDNELTNKDIYVYNNKLYILHEYKKCEYYNSSEIRISVFELFDEFWEKVQEYEKTQINDYNLKIIVMNDEQIFLLGKKICMLLQKG